MLESQILAASHGGGKAFTAQEAALEGTIVKGSIMKWAKRVGVVILVLLVAGFGYVWYSIRAQNTPAPPDPTLETRDVQFNPDLELPKARFYREKDKAPVSAILWMHGGAFVGGSMNMPEGDEVSRSLAHAGYLVLNMEYRKVSAFAGLENWLGTPVPRFPDNVLDCLEGWRRLLKEAATYNIPPERIFIGGASAGGTLATMTTIYAQREKLQSPAGVVLAYPVLHSSLPGFADVRKVALMYVGKRNEARVDDAYPKKADLTTFPPTIIINSETDPLRPSGELFARELTEAGRKVDVHTEPGSNHGHLNKIGTSQYEKSMTAYIEWMRAAAPLPATADSK